MRVLSYKAFRSVTLSLCLILASCSLLDQLDNKDRGGDGEKVSSKSEKDSAKAKGGNTTSSTPQEKEKVKKRPVHHGSEALTHDLVHTVLDVEFDMKERELLGQAEIDLSPHFYPKDTLYLDAKAFDVHKVELLMDSTRRTLDYSYDGRRIRIDLGRTYSRKDTFRVAIDYTANPTEVQVQGSQAIASAQGLYFIDPKGEDPHKPTQIWTQGETESSSCWFPTIDQPNQRMSQEISITVPDSLKTLSNGALQYSLKKGEGMRTDVWAQEKNHPPYLTMMAIGDFAVVEDEWNDLPVNYWVEPEYEESAMEIFGRTPEMIEFYSDTFNIPYPWAKYDQVVVRDFVSGAMENTTATVHGSMQRKTERELIDGDEEPTIAHELIHHWFGNIVTCESWANLPLNEAFATYGEYLWEEHEYGREEADKLLQNKLNTYLRAYRGKNKQVPLIRYDYEQRERMFDAFSYHKASRVLHMLRKYVGDDAFFASLEKYLKDNAYEPVEIHELRLAFEEVTGEDLHWFFGQWFMKKGHPILDISYSYDKGSGKQLVIVEQEQDFEEWPLYKLPIKIDLYYGSERIRKSVTVENSIDTFSFDVKRRPDLVNVDAGKMLLCEKTDHKRNAAYIHQYEHAPLYLDRYEAVAHCKDRRDSLSAELILKAVKDDHYKIRQLALSNMESAFRYFPEKAADRLLEAARSDPHPPTRATAVGILDDHRERLGVDPDELYEKALEDSSYLNVATALRSISENDLDRAVSIAEVREKRAGGALVHAIGVVYAKKGLPGKNAFFQDRLAQMGGIRSTLPLLRTYSRYLRGQDLETKEEAIPILEKKAIEGTRGRVQATAVRILQGMKVKLKKERRDIEKELEKLRKKEKSGKEKKEKSEKKKKETGLTREEKKERQRLKGELRSLEESIRTLDESLERIEKNVKNPRVLRFL